MFLCKYDSIISQKRQKVNRYFSWGQPNAKFSSLFAEFVCWGSYAASNTPMHPSRKRTLLQNYARFQQGKCGLGHNLGCKEGKQRWWGMQFGS